MAGERVGEEEEVEELDREVEGLNLEQRDRRNSSDWMKVHSAGAGA